EASSATDLSSVRSPSKRSRAPLPFWPEAPLVGGGHGCGRVTDGGFEATRCDGQGTPNQPSITRSWRLPQISRSNLDDCRARTVRLSDEGTSGVGSVRSGLIVVPGAVFETMSTAAAKDILVLLVRVRNMPGKREGGPQRGAKGTPNAGR